LQSFLHSWLPLQGESQFIIAGSGEQVGVGNRTQELNLRYQQHSEGGRHSKTSLPISSAAHYLPVLQGPLQRYGGEKTTTSTARNATDICVPCCRALSSDLSSQVDREGVPVLIVAYSDGSVESLLLDCEEDHLSLVLPAWRSLNRLKPDVTPHSFTQFQPSLMTLENTNINLSSQTECRQWKLTPDPVVSHYVHVTSAEYCQSFLLVCRWLESATKQLQKQTLVEENEEPLIPSQRVNFATQESKDNTYANSTVLSIRGGGNNDDEEEEEDDAFLRRKFNSRQLLTSPSDVMYRKQKEDESEMDLDIKAYPSESIPIIDLLKDSSGGMRICGLCVLRDPFAGHTVLFRTFSSSSSDQSCEVWAVNLTVHATLCELFQQQASRAYERDSVCRPMQEALRITASEQTVRWKHAQKTISDIAVGLKNMPQVLRLAQQQQLQLLQQEVERESNADLNSEEITKKVLAQAAVHVQRDVLMPMGDLLNVTKFHYDLVQETRRSQQEILNGWSPAGDDSTNRSSGEGYPPLSAGLVTMLDVLEDRQRGLKQRVEQIRSKYEQQREAAEKFLTFAISQTTQLSRGEQQYKRQLEEWSAKVVRLGDQLDALQRLVPRQAQPLPSSSPVPPTPSTLVASSQLASSLRSPQPFPSPAPGPSPILPSASPLMTTWRSPSFSYEPSARRGQAYSASGPSSDRKHTSSGLRLTAQHRQTPRRPLLSEDEQAACQQLLGAQLSLIANSKSTVLALQERLGELVRTAQHSKS